MHLQLFIQYRDDIRDAKSFGEIWHRLSNDQVFALEMYYHAATGHEIQIMVESSEEAWLRLPHVLDGLDRITDLLNQEFAKAKIVSVADDVHRAAEIADKVANDPAVSNDIQWSRLAEHMRNQLLRVAARVAADEDRLSDLVTFFPSKGVDIPWPPVPEVQLACECGSGLVACPQCKEPFTFCPNCAIPVGHACPSG